MQKFGIFITNEWLDWALENLTPLEHAVFYAVLRQMNLTTRKVLVPQGMLAMKTKLSLRSVGRGIKGLADKHVIKSVRLPPIGGKAYGANCYFVMVYCKHKIVPPYVTSKEIDNLIEEFYGAGDQKLS